MTAKARVYGGASHNRQRCGFDRSSNRPLHIYFREAMPQSLLRFGCWQVIPHAARSDFVV